MEIKGDHVYGSFLNEFDTFVESEFEDKLVLVKPEFSNSNEFKRDVQMTLDENLINNQLLSLFNNNKVYSLFETIIYWIPDNY
jgi:isocitrate dehydrogenase